MTAASNPAAELTEAERMDRVPDLAVLVAEDVWTEDEPTLAEYELTAAILASAARLAAGGAAADEGLRARAEAFLVQCGPCDGGLPMACACPDEDPRPVIADLLAALDAAPAPTEDATCDTCQDAGRVPWMSEGDPHGYQERDSDGTIPCPDCAADTAAVEPRTEAQIKAEALREAADDLECPAYLRQGHEDTCHACMKARWLRDRADRLSRAEEEAGS